MSGGLYVVETDAPCLLCGEQHGVVTRRCDLAVFVDRGTALWVSRGIEGSAVREIEEVPEGISYTLYLHKDGRPDERYPKTSRAMSGN